MNDKIISIIPARGGSKGIPKKNIYEISGTPLISHTIAQSLQSELINETFVSTDCKEIAEISKAAGAEILMRPQDLANDTASSESALIDALKQIEALYKYTPKYIVFLQCTSPIREKNDIDNAIQQLIQEKADSLLSVVDSHRFLWEMTPEGANSINYDYHSRKRRQDLNPQYCENGSIYIFKPEDLLKNNNRLSGKVALYIMKPETGFEIDNFLDIQVIESIFEFKNINK